MLIEKEKVERKKLRLETRFFFKLQQKICLAFKKLWGKEVDYWKFEN